MKVWNEQQFCMNNNTKVNASNWLYTLPDKEPMHGLTPSCSCSNSANYDVFLKHKVYSLQKQDLRKTLELFIILHMKKQTF